MRRPFWLLLALLLIAPLILAACGDDDDMAGMDHGSETGTMVATAATDAASSPTHDMGAMSSPTHDMASMGSPTGEMDMDLMFIDSMIPHHQSAIDMAEVAREEAEHQEIKDLAQEIIDAQQAEIDQLKTWRDEWFPGAPESGGMPGMEHEAGMDMTEMDLEKLRAADPFDQAFIDEMIPHHESAIMMAREIQPTTERPELQELADAIITAQEGEIEQMQEWRSEWFGE